MTILDLMSFHLVKFSAHRYLDWSAIMLLGDRPNTIVEAVYALFIHLVWAGFLGVIFAFLIMVIGRRGLLLKGAILGFIAGFIFYAIPKLFETNQLYATPIESVIANHSGAVVWGLLTAYVIVFLEHRYTD